MAANQLGRYQIIREIARSNDVVYEAVDPSLGKRIALKELVIPANLVGQARRERIQRFTREARAAAGLRHPSIVHIHDHGEIQGRYYIAMEYLEGQSLRDVLRQRGALPLHECLRIGSAVADGLDFAHRHGTVHRDVKPDNIHLEPDGRVVITDFGIARLTFEPTLTADGQVFGTPSYMSPEQVGGKSIDGRSDLFSLGVMLYEMVMGRKPFQGDSVITITYNIMHQEVPPLVGAPPGLDAVVRRATAKEPAHRYRSAAEMAEDLRLVAQGAPPRHAAPERLPPRLPTPLGSPGWPPPSGPVALPAPVSVPRSPAPPVFGPLPGARAMPTPRAGPPGVPPLRVPAPFPPSGGAAAPGLPQMSILQQRQARRQAGLADAKWLVGWLGVAVVVAGMLLVLVWAGVTAFDRFRSDTAVRAMASVRSEADTAFRAGRWHEAAEAYLRVAESAPAAERVTAHRNAAVALAKLAESQVEAAARDAETSARRAIDLDPDLALAWVILGRALAGQARIDDAVAAFDGAVEAAKRIPAGATDARAGSIRDAAAVAPVWKAETLYRDGVAQMGTNDLLARQRFEEAARAAPGSRTARNAQVRLQQLGVADAAPGTGGLPPAPDGYEPMKDWDRSYNFGPGAAPDGGQ